MERFVKGDVVVVPFPFSDLTQAKKRPAYVLASPDGNDLILCQITSQAVRDGYAVPINDNDFDEGSLRQPSNIRPNRIFTADTQIVLYKVGHLKEDKLIEVTFKAIDLIRK